MKTRLTDEDVSKALATLDRDGYTVIEGVVPSSPLDDFARYLADEYERAQAEGRLFQGGGSVTGHLDCYPGAASRFIYDAVAEHGILDIARKFSPDDVDRLRVTMNYNLPGSHPQHYHSDGLYTEAFLICNVAVVDTDLENGAIDLLPGTHHRFYKFWQYAVQRKHRDSTRVAMSQGDVLLRISTVWHRGMPNRTSAPRPLMSLTFGETSAPSTDPFDERVEFLPNWYGTSRLSQIRERTVVKMPWLYSTYRFGRSLVGNKGYSSW